MSYYRVMAAICLGAAIYYLAFPPFEHERSEIGRTAVILCQLFSIQDRLAKKESADVRS